MQAVGIQAIGVKVGRGDDAHPVGKQGLQEPMQDHGVGDIGHVKLVEADQPKALGDALAKLVQGILQTFEFRQLAVHLAHELVKVKARFAPQRHRQEEAVHQEALAATHPTVHVHATRDWRLDQEPSDRIAALLQVLLPLVLAALQGINGTHLGRVGGKAALGQGAFKKLAYAHQGAIRSSACACRRPRPLPWWLRSRMGVHGKSVQCPLRWP